MNFGISAVARTARIITTFGATVLLRVMEIAGRDELFSSPKHPYTQALISAVPIPDPEAELSRQHIVLEGELPSPLSPPSGCHFRPRCYKADATCAAEVPMLRDAGNRHRVACHHLDA